MQTISRELLEIIACPKCKSGVQLSRNSDALICHKCKLVYKIRHGIPVMLVDEAITMAEYKGENGS